MQIQKRCMNEKVKEIQNVCAVITVPVSFMKLVAEYIATPVTYITIKCIECKTFSDQWKTPRFHPIPKLK